MKIRSKFFRIVIAFISLLASVIGIYAFISGNSSLKQLISKEGGVVNITSNKNSDIINRTDHKKYVTFNNKEFFGFRFGVEIFLHDNQDITKAFKSSRIEVSNVSLSPDSKKICFIKSKQFIDHRWIKTNDLIIMNIENLEKVSYSPNSANLLSNSVWVDNYTIAINIEQDGSCNVLLNSDEMSLRTTMQKRHLNNCKVKEFAGFSFEKFGVQRIKIDKQNIITEINSL